MNNLLIFFALPVAVIIFAIVLQKLLKSPILVAAFIFAIFLVVAFAVFDETFLVFVILYSLLALITALITRFVCCLIRNSTNPCINANAGVSDDMDESDNSNCNCNCNCNRSYITPYFPRRNVFRR